MFVLGEYVLRCRCSCARRSHARPGASFTSHIRYDLSYAMVVAPLSMARQRGLLAPRSPPKQNITLLTNLHMTVIYMHTVHKQELN